MLVAPFHILHLILSLYIVATCNDLGRSIDNGNVSYTRDPTKQGHYLENTTVTVTCDEGYKGGGSITCQNDGNWSSLSLPHCIGELSLITNALMYHAIHLSHFYR